MGRIVRELREMRLNSKHPALSEKRTIHPKQVYTVSGYKTNVLKSAKHNSKLSEKKNEIQKGRWKGFPIYSLTLEERKTCPPSCHHWTDCYGNATPFAHRFEHGKDLEICVRNELPVLASKHPNGFVVRLHILGDFYSCEYANFWIDNIQAIPQLHIFGYTAHEPQSDIGRILVNSNLLYPSRFRIRFSTNRVHTEHIPLALSGTVSTDAITCPEMQGKADSCCDCSLCWETSKNIFFPTH